MGAGPRGERVYGEWQAGKELGAGGNGKVYSASGALAGHYAIKVLQARRGERFQRFAAEIQFLESNRNLSGILPIVDSQLAVESGPHWYVMPMAVPIREALGADSEPGTVVSAIAVIAKTLSDLADREIFHRDIKPDNLFQLAGEWVVGDFGLVSYPEKEPLTLHGRKLGPIDYLAPEMREDADTANAELADVWALAKTLWVLLAGQNVPLPGNHDPADPVQSLANRLSGYTRVNEIDRLIERSTRVDPTRRPSMREFQKELEECLRLPPEGRVDASLAELRERMGAFTQPITDDIVSREDLIAELNNCCYQMEAAVRRCHNELGLLLTFGGPVPGDSSAVNSLLRPFSVDRLCMAWSCQLQPPGQRPRACVTIGYSMDVDVDAGSGDIAALLKVDDKARDGTYAEMPIYSNVWRGVPVPSAQFSNLVQQVELEFRSRFAEVMRICLQIIAEAGSATWD